MCLDSSDACIRSGDNEAQNLHEDGLPSMSTLDSFLDAPTDYLARGISGDAHTLPGKTLSMPKETDISVDLKEPSLNLDQDVSCSHNASVNPRNTPKPERKKRMSKKERAALKSGSAVNLVSHQSTKSTSGMELLHIF